MKNIVILGCGFAGIEAAFWLDRMGSKDINLSVIDQMDAMIYTPSLIWLPPKKRTLEDISIELEPVLASKDVTFYNNKASSINAREQTVLLDSGREIAYDYLIIATGWRSKRSHIKGSENILFPCDLPDVLELTRIIDEMDGGTITFAIEGERPGPGAEYIGLIDYYLREKGIRHRFNLNLAEEKHRLLIHLGRDACDLITANFEDRGINLHLGMNLVAARPGVAILKGDVEIPSDIICSVGKLEAPEVLQKLDISDEDGFIPVHDELSCRAYPNIYVAGDAARYGNPNVPKVAHLAIHQGQLAAQNIYADIFGLKKQQFDTKHAFENLYLLSDLGGMSVLVKNYKIVKHGAVVSFLKESIERYYLYTHRLGLSWHPFATEVASA